MCEVREEGAVLHLKDVIVYSRLAGGLKGVLKEMLAARTELKRYAAAMGFVTLKISGYRTEQSSSAHPGKTIDLTIDLRKRRDD
jgi:hypothetical protein